MIVRIVGVERLELRPDSCGELFRLVLIRPDCLWRDIIPGSTVHHPFELLSTECLLYLRNGVSEGRDRVDAADVEAASIAFTFDYLFVSTQVWLRKPQPLFCRKDSFFRKLSCFSVGPTNIFVELYRICKYERVQRVVRIATSISVVMKEKTTIFHQLSYDFSSMTCLSARERMSLIVVCHVVFLFGVPVVERSKGVALRSAIATMQETRIKYKHEFYSHSVGAVEIYFIKMISI